MGKGFPGNGLIFEGTMTTPGYHVVARVQNTNRPQSNILCSIKHLLVLTREYIEVGNRSSYFRDRENRYSFAVYFEGSHIGSSTFDCSNCLYCNFDSISSSTRDRPSNSTDAEDAETDMYLCCKATENCANIWSLRIPIEYAIIIYNAVRCWD